MKLIIKLSLFATLSFSAGGFAADRNAASEEQPANLLYIELLGNGGLMSLNYERYLLSDASVRVGGMFYSGEAPWYLVIPVHIYSFFGNNHKFQIGVGVDFRFTEWDTSYSNSYQQSYQATLGYRYLPLGGNYMLQITAGPQYIPRKYCPGEIYEHYSCGFGGIIGIGGGILF